MDPDEYQLRKLYENNLTSRRWQGGYGRTPVERTMDEIARLRQLTADHIEKLERERERARQMAAINMCDRCGSLMKGNAAGRLHLQDSPADKQEVRDICPGCVKECRDWLKAAPGPRERAYTQPYEPAAAPSVLEAASVDELTKVLIHKVGVEYGKVVPEVEQK